MSLAIAEKVVVMAGPRCLALVDAAQARRLAKAPNAEVIRRRKDRRIVEIRLHQAGDDSREPKYHGNSRRYSHKKETSDNPQNVWTLKPIADRDRAVFCRVALDCAA